MTLPFLCRHLVLDSYCYCCSHGSVILDDSSTAPASRFSAVFSGTASGLLRRRPHRGNCSEPPGHHNPLTRASQMAAMRAAYVLVMMVTAVVAASESTARATQSAYSPYGERWLSTTNFSSAATSHALTCHLLFVCSFIAAWACAGGLGKLKGCAETTCNAVQANIGGNVLVLATGSMTRVAPGEEHCRRCPGASHLLLRLLLYCLTAAAALAGKHQPPFETNQ